jgi:hypothetical protein
MGQRIAEQVRRALIAAAKAAPVAVAIDASGCSDDWPCGTGCVFDEPPTCPPPCKPVPVSGSYGFGALALVFPFDAMPRPGPGFHGSHLCEARAPFLVEFPLESCKKLCADSRYVFSGKYSDNDEILSCSSYSVEYEMGTFRPPSGCFPDHLNCVAEYPPGATACDGGADAATDASTTSTDAGKESG